MITASEMGIKSAENRGLYKMTEQERKDYMRKVRLDGIAKKKREVDTNIKV